MLRVGSKNGVFLDRHEQRGRGVRADVVMMVVVVINVDVGRERCFLCCFSGSESCFGMRSDELADLPRLEDYVSCQRMIR